METTRIGSIVSAQIGHRDASPDKNGDGKITKNEWIKECPCFDAKSEFPIAVVTAKRYNK